MERPEAAAAMVEHPIQHKSHPPPMHCSYQGIEGGIAAKQWINLEVIKGVVPMIGG
ncbi:MAG: Uncharacterised protein [Synechococcus sp. CC9902]|nr:MAG: Uncharacterised protein [Synechococcus sp. CC9902]